MKNSPIKLATREGAHHWIKQRVTGIANIFIISWFMISMIMIGLDQIENARTWLAHPFNAIMMLIMLGDLFYHASLGIRVVIEDYIHHPMKKYSLLIFLAFANYGAFAIGVFSVFHIYASVNF